MRALVIAALVAATACGSVKSAKPDARGSDDAGAADALPPPMPAQGAALLSAAGHLTGNGWAADVQLGAPISATPASSSADQLITAGTLSP